MSRQQRALDAMRLLRARFRDARLGQAAGSLTFTTLIALVPLLTVGLALFSAFPAFSAFQEGLQKMFLQSLIPDTIAKPVLQAVTQFAAKAARLGAAGLLMLMVSALALMVTIDRALNHIWRVRRPRPLSRRLVIYAAAITLGPLAVGVSFTFTSWAFTAARGWGPMVPGLQSALVDVLESLVLMAGVMALFRWLPNALVTWRDAALGAAFVAVTFSAAKGLLGWYVKLVPTYGAVYGTFATLPILLLWIYIVWVLVLMGALLAASAPGLRGGLRLDHRLPGARFTLALDLLRTLAQVRDTEEPSRSLNELAERTQADILEAREVADQMAVWGWLVRAEEDGPLREGYLLRLHPRQIDLTPAVEAWLMAPQPANEGWRRRFNAQRLTLADVLEGGGVSA